MKYLIQIVCLVVSATLGITVALTGSWDVLEPVIGLGTLGAAIGTYFQTRKKVVKTFDNFDGSWTILIQEDLDIVKEVKDFFGGIDCIIDFRINEDFDDLKELLTSAIEQGQANNKALKIVIQSSSKRFSLKIGQFVGTSIICDIFNFEDNSFTEIK